MKITEELCSKILLSLPKGYAKKISGSCAVSETTVYQVLHHGQNNMKVAMALLKLATETKAKNRKAQKSARHLIKQL